MGGENGKHNTAGDEKGDGTESVGQRAPPWGGEPGAEAGLLGGSVLVKVPGKVCQAEGTASAKAPKNGRSLVHSRHRKTNVGTCSERHLDTMAVLGILQKLN